MEEPPPPKRQKTDRIYHQYSRHVTGALTPDKLDFYRKYPKFIPKRFPELNLKWYQDVSSGVVKGVTVFTWLEKYLLANRPFADQAQRQKVELVWNTIEESLQPQIEHLTHKLGNSDSSLLTDQIQRLKAHPGLQEAASDKAFIINLHNNITDLAARGDRTFFLTDLPNIEFLGDLIILHDFPGGLLVITYQMFVNCLDKIEARFSWEFYSA